jgi:methionyl-tRNA formyltransferase
MKVVLLARDGATGRYLAHVLARNDWLDALVVEGGAAARRRKIRRTLRGRGLVGAFDLFAIAIYNMIAERQLKRFAARAGASEWPAVPQLLVVDDVNDEKAAVWLREIEPDVVVISGTSILRQPVLSTAKSYTVNVHGGLLPEYRNVHSEFWAFVSGAPDRIGSAVIHVDAGVDSGDVALQRAVVAEAGASLSELRVLNLRVAGELLEEAIALAQRGELPRVAQNGAAGFHPTPTARDLARLVRWRR